MHCLSNLLSNLVATLCPIFAGTVSTLNITCENVRDVGEEGMRNVTILWETNEKFPDRTSGYSITLRPVDPPGPDEVYTVVPGSPEFMERRMELSVPLGVENNIFVWTLNCGDRNGSSVVKTLLYKGRYFCTLSCKLYK